MEDSLCTGMGEVYRSAAHILRLRVSSRLAIPAWVLLKSPAAESAYKEDCTVGFTVSSEHGRKADSP